MNVLALQFNSVWHDGAANLAVLKQLFSEYVTDKTDVVVLPETFHAGFSMQPERFAESIEGDISQALSQLATTYGVNVVAGVAQREVRGRCDGQGVRFYNRALCFDRSGVQVGRYTKQKLFRYANEDKAFAAGHSPTVVYLDGRPFALFICYDLRFPELFRAVARSVEGLMVIANWPDSRQAHWEALLKARAIENQCFVIGVNRTGRDENGLGYEGGSSILSPLGEVLAYGAPHQIAIHARLDLDEVAAVREQFPFLKDM